MQAIITRLSEASGVGSSMVWGAILRAYFEGGHLEDPELQELINEAMPDNFFEKLREAKTEKQAREILDMFKPPVLQVFKEKVSDWVNRRFKLVA